MKHCVAAVAVGLTVGIAGCDDGAQTRHDTQDMPPSAPASASAQDMGLPGTTSKPNEAPVTAAPSAKGASIEGAPSFVDLYPGAEIILTEGASPPHQLRFTTEAQPDTVIAYYKARAESSGLHPTAAMNQGSARAYGASDRSETGASLQVVASPTEEGLTTVQLNWSPRRP